MTATLLPPPRFCFFDQLGNPLSGGFVNVLDPATMLPKTSWQDEAQSTPNTQPIVLDANGSCLLYGSGNYYLQTTDYLGNQIPEYSGLTQDWLALANSTFLLPGSLANDTTDPSGSCLVGYFHQVTGFVGRMVCDRLFDRVSAADFGADPGGGSDATQHIQAAINYLQSVGGGTLWINRGSFIVNGTLNITGNNVTIRGDGPGSVLNFQGSGTADCFKIGFQTAVVSGTILRDFQVLGTGKTGGWLANINTASGVRISGIVGTGGSGAVSVDTITDVLIDACNFSVTASIGGTGAAAISWTSQALSTTRSDGLWIRNTTVTCSNLTIIGVLVDGYCHRLKITDSQIANCQDGLVLRNSPFSSSYYVTQVYVSGLQVDSVSRSAVTIAAGRAMKFVNCDLSCSGVGTDVVVITSDMTASLTADIKFVGCRITAGLQHGVVCEAQQVDFVGCTVNDNSRSGSGLFPAIHLINNGTLAAKDINVIGCRFAVVTDTTICNYGVTCDSTVAHVNIVGNDFTYLATGAILDANTIGGNVTWSNNVSINGLPLPNKIPTLPGPPPDLHDGDMWLDNVAGQLHIQIGGTVRTVTVT